MRAGMRGSRGDALFLRIGEEARRKPRLDVMPKISILYLFLIFMLEALIKQGGVSKRNRTTLKIYAMRLKAHTTSPESLRNAGNNIPEVGQKASEAA